MNKRLKETPDIPTVFYGAPFSDHEEVLKKFGSIWVDYANGEFGDETEICLKSGSNAPEQLENHIVWFYSKIDPNVVLCNRYSNLNGLFIGVRYKFVSKWQIKTFEAYRVIDETVVFKEDLERIEDGDEADYICWGDLHDRHNELNDLARKELIASYPDKKRYLQWELSNLNLPPINLPRLR